MPITGCDTALVSPIFGNQGNLGPSARSHLVDIVPNKFGGLGPRKGSVEKSHLLSGIARISEPPPTPQFGQLGPLFSGRQNNVLRV